MIATPVAGKVAHDNLADVIGNEQKIAEIRAEIQSGTTYVMKSHIKESTIMQIREYLTGIGRSSIPNYQPLRLGAPNFHRINYWDQRAHVQGCFHQFSFFPWNQDVFNLYELMRPIFQVKNLLSGSPANRFLNATPDDDCTARLTFQFYPKSVGGLNRHKDPVDHHQLTIPILLMSRKGEGKDFQQGGLYIEREDGSKIYFDELGEPGDVVFFNAQCTHGVDCIDPHKETDWTSFQGRWMGLFVVNELIANGRIANSQDLGDDNHDHSM